MQCGWDDNRLPRMLGCLFGCRRGMFEKIAQHGANSSLYKFLLFKSAKTNIKEPQGCFRVRLRNAHYKCQFNFVKRHTTMNLLKTWWKTVQGSRQSSSQRRTCFPKNQARKGPFSNRANLHLELPGLRSLNSS